MIVPDINLLVYAYNSDALGDATATRYVAAMPALRWLRAQEAVATDDGFEALSRSQTPLATHTRL